MALRPKDPLGGHTLLTKVVGLLGQSAASDALLSLLLLVKTVSLGVLGALLLLGGLAIRDAVDELGANVRHNLLVQHLLKASTELVVIVERPPLPKVRTIPVSQVTTYRMALPEGERTILVSGLPLAYDSQVRALSRCDYFLPAWR